MCFSGQRIRGVCQGDLGGPLLWEDKTEKDRAYALAIVATYGNLCSDKWWEKEFIPATGVWIPAIQDWISFTADSELQECSPWIQESSYE